MCYDGKGDDTVKKKIENICRFVQQTPSLSLSITNFVYETNHEVMENMKIKKDSAMYLVVSGKGILVNEDIKKELSMGTMFFTFAAKHFRIENTDDLKYIYISFSGERAEELFRRFSITPKQCVFYGCEGLVPFWQNAIVQAAEKNSDLVSESVLLYSFSTLVHNVISGEQRLADSIRTYIDENFKDSELDLANVAEYFGYNLKYVSRIFKEDTGMTFSRYLTHTRIKHAVFLMEQGITSVKNAALLCGYNDSMYFSRVFKKETGVSASEYIKSKNNV